MNRKSLAPVALVVVLLIVLAGSLVPMQAAQPSEEPQQHTGSKSGVPDPGTLVARTDMEQRPVEVPTPSPLALRYYRSGMWLWALGVCWSMLVPAAMAFSGFSATLRDLAHRLGRYWFLSVGLYVVLYLGLVFLIDLPLNYYAGFVRQHAYGLSNQSPGRWFTKSVLHLGVEMLAGFAFAWVPLLLLSRSPRRWWLYSALLSVPFLFSTVLVMPIWIDPLFNKFGPMKNQALEQSILELAQRAGIEGSRVFEVDKSADTRMVNAYVTGVLGTKRIVLWDTLLDRLDEKEVLAVMGHEMGHYVMGHVVWSILLSSLLTLTGLFVVDRLGRWLIARYAHRLRFQSLSDIAAVPLILLLIEVSSLFLSPVAMAYSRFQEHAADRFALDLTHANHSAATAFVKLQHENLSNPRPGLIYKVFRGSHPSIGERIDFCNSYHPANASAPLPARHD